MALIVGTNSWVTVAEADTYFATKWGASAWATLPNASKESLLITAYNWIQAQSMFTIAPSATDQYIKNAQFETAWYVYKFFDEHEKRRALIASGVTRFQISEFEEDLDRAGFPEFISDMLKDSITGGTGTFPVASRPFDQ